MSDPDRDVYFRYTGPQRLAKALTTIRGLLVGISTDGIISEEETRFLAAWMKEHSEERDLHPFSEIIPAIESAMCG